VIVVAPATAWGHSALAMVRASGKGVRDLLHQVVTPLHPGPWAANKTRRVVFSDDKGAFDDGLAIWSPGPRTYTGEELFELSCHGNPRIVERLVNACVAAGARLAEPGEFTRRAVSAGRMTLLDAEAVDLACRATSDAGLQIARTVFDGTLGASIAALREALVFVAAELEARLDWPGDDLATMDDQRLLSRVAEVGNTANRLSASHAEARLLIEGARVAFIGPANAGKSSLFNVLVGSRRALVHATPGTTRDVVEASVRLGPLTVTLYDTAGLRETSDPVEQAGLELAREVLEGCDLLLATLPVERWVDPEARELPEVLRDKPCLWICNGVDRVSNDARPAGVLCTSAVTGEGQDALEQAVVKALLGERFVTDTLRIASKRQAQLLAEVRRHCDDVPQALQEAGPAVAASTVLLAIEEIDGLTGADSQEDVLSSLFERFCIGK